MFVLAYDTETTGLPLFKEPSEHPDQPHLVQLAACLVHLETRKVHASIDLIVRPNGWTIPDEVAQLHGITQERAMDEGVPEEMAVELLLDLWQEGKRVRLAHNESFDARILRIACKRYVDLKLPPTDRMKAAKRFHHKSANLSEAYKFFTGNDLVDAHSAMPDVQACLAVYFAIKQPEAVAA